ncbi:MAG: hypothetical protein WHS44_00950 [Fimbriimonadales bacterium]|nr:MAG: hypothetical protein KatS3mg018_0757 [Fimbriimonadales bacterium]
MFYPTMVVAIGDLSRRAVHEAHELLEAFRSPARATTALCAFERGDYEAIHVPESGDASAFDAPLTRWLYATRLEQNIHRARQQGMEIGPPGGYLLEQLLLVFDSDAYADALRVADDLRALCERADDLVPARLHWLVLHPSYDSPLPPAIWQDHLTRLRASSAVQEGKMHLLRLVRSDGSVITHEQLRETVAYMLLTALHPAEFVGEHWLYRSVVDTERAPSTIGCGLVTLPLHKIIQCLQDKLVADALSCLLSGANDATGLPTPEEAQLWTQIVGQSVQGWDTSDGARVQAQSALGLSVTIPVPSLSASTLDSSRLAAGAEWETTWQEQRLPRWRTLLQSAARDAADAYHESLHASVQQYLRAPNANLLTLQSRLQALLRSVEGWQIYTLTPHRPSGERKAALHARLEKAIAQAQQSKGGLFRRRTMPDPQIVNDYTQALQDYYAQHMRVDAHDAHRAAADRIRQTLGNLLQSVSAAVERIQQEIRERQNRVRAFYLPSLPWLRPLVYRWEHLESTAHALWGGRDLSALVYRMIDPERDLREQLPWIIGQLENNLQQWMTSYYRSFSYYLRARFPNLQARVAWCEQQVEQMRSQADRVLWRTEKATPQLWQVAPPEERSSLPAAAAAPIRDWQSDTMLGYLAVARETVLETDS